MSDNKFIKRLKGKQTEKALLEIQDAGSVTSFANMPHGTSNSTFVYADRRNNAIGVLKGALNWKINGTSMVLADPDGDGSDYTGSDPVAGETDQYGNNLWINASYTVPAGGLFLTKNTKWVLKLCGDNMVADGGAIIDFTVLITVGSGNNITKSFTVTSSALYFCKEFIIDFAESNTSTIKLQQGDTITLKLLCGTPTASARIYLGMSTLTLLQRAVDAESVISNNGSYEDVLEELAKKLNIDGTSTMTGVLKMRASTSFECAIAPYWHGVGLYKLNDNDSVTLLASMEGTDGWEPGANNTYNMGTPTKKWKNLYLAGTAYVSTLNNGANISVPTTGGTLGLNDFSNITDSAKNISNWSTNVSNCLTEIPQDINLELSSGTLTLKAGSKVHIANGNLDETDTTTADISVTNAYDGQYMVIRNSATSLYMGRIESSFSGTIANRPSSTPNSTGFYFATDENKIYLTGNSGANWYSGSTFTLPLAIVTVSGGAISSIDQVFNGFGYIGSTVFALSGIKGLAPNGRNADGTLKNTSFTVSSVRTNTLSSSTFDKRVLYLGISSAYGFSPNLEYLPETNTFNSAGQYVIVGWGSASSGVITHLELKTAFHAVDYNDKEYIAHQAMPSDKYIDLSSTTITDGMTLTAPADGYYSLYRVSSAAGQMIGFVNSNTGFATRVFSSDTGETLGVFIPVSKGQTIMVRNSAGGSVTYFRFIYANGTK